MNENKNERLLVLLSLIVFAFVIITSAIMDKNEKLSIQKQINPSGLIYKK